MSIFIRRGADRRLSVIAFTAVAVCASGAFAQHQSHGAAPAANAPAASSAAVKVGDLVLVAPWTRQPPDGARVAGGFLKITNNGKTSDRLVGGSAPFAKRFEVHEMAMADGVMKMRELTKGLEIKPGETVELKPGSYHVMYMDITERPKTGTSVKTTLKFEKAGDVTIDVPVVAPGQSGAAPKLHH